jgi:GNAT superfamily N-acetyltransferase
VTPYDSGPNLWQAAIDGQDLLFRAARPGDRAKLDAMYRRCGPVTRYLRWGGFLRQLPEQYVAGCLAGDSQRHDALVVEAPAAARAAPRDGGARQLVALASAARVAGVTGAPTVEIGLLVEDRWQGQGIGRRLLHELARRARARGVEALYAHIVEGCWPRISSLGADMQLCHFDAGQGIVEVTFRMPR